MNGADPGWLLSCEGWRPSYGQPLRIRRRTAADGQVENVAARQMVSIAIERGGEH